jgi:nucleoside-diphosphate-sugar epimerase
MKILVTGGAGFVGSRLMSSLLMLGHEVVCYDRLDFGVDPIRMYFEQPNFTFVQGDIQNTLLLKTMVKQADVIVHLAALVGYPACDANPNDAMNVNVHAAHALNAYRHHDQRVIFASTGSVYGKIADVACDEETPLNPTSLYARTKMEGEKAFLDKGNVVVLRFATGFGLSPRQRNDTLVNDFVRQTVQNHQLSVYQPHALRSIIHVLDMTRAIVQALDFLHEGVYNCAAMNITKLELAQLIRRCGVSYTLEIVENATDPECRDYQTRCAKLEQGGYVVAKVNTKQAIVDLARYYDSAG